MKLLSPPRVSTSNAASTPSGQSVSSHSATPSLEHTGAGRLKILFVSMEYPPETNWGGIAMYTACMARALAARGHEVHVLSCVRDQQHRDYLDQAVHVHRRKQVQIPGLWRLNWILHLSMTYSRIQTGLSNYLAYMRLGIDFDVIEYPEKAAEGWCFALLRTKPLVAHLHSLRPILYRYRQFRMNRDRRWMGALEHVAIRRADVITCPSGLFVPDLEESGWLRGLPVEVIPQPIDCSRWSNTQPVSDTRATVLFLGRLELGKAPEVLVMAMSIVRTEIPDAEALFVGKNKDKRDGLSYLEWMMKTASDLTGCRFVEQVPENEVLNFLSASRVLAVPSWHEVYSVVALEAMAAGRPVVVTATNGAAELVEQTGAGRVVPAGDPKALADALLPFLRDPSYAAEVGKRAREAARERVDVHKIAAQREAAYHRAIARSRHGLQQSRKSNSLASSV